MRKKILFGILLGSLVLHGCISDTLDDAEIKQITSSDTIQDDTIQNEAIEESEIEVTPIEITKAYKDRGNTNPIIAQTFGADPYAMVYEDSVYFYMTADAFEHEATGAVKENTYSRIKSIHVVATKDMKNFTDYGFIPVAGKNGIATWANNSWAPAACHKTINGKEKFFLYFADNGGGIGVLEADSPVGPFTDPLGHALINRSIPNCDNVLWLFDPAVLVDTDGTGYLYFGGGVPEGKADAPGTARAVKLGEDMISLATDPVVIDAPYVFEDSGIHKYNDKYYYSYCTNWNVDDAGKAQYGFNNAEIVTMVSDNPLGPFEFKEVILSNPGTLCGLYGNNHHCVFEFKDQWYITYHSRLLEKKIGVELGYRNTCIDSFEMKEDGSIGKITQTYKGPEQLEYINPYTQNNAVCVANMVGTETKTDSNGNPILGGIHTGDYIEIDGVDFSNTNPKSISITANVKKGKPGKIHVRLDYINSDDICVIDLPEDTVNNVFSADILPSISIDGIHYLFFLFEGQDYTVENWKFN